MIIAFNATSLFAVLFLVFLEGILSLDNALALALMVRHLPEKQQKRALTWGIWGAFAFRFVALFFLTQLMHLTWIKVLGSIYLFFIAIKGIVEDPDVDVTEWKSGRFNLLRTIIMVELVDMAFSADSILAAVSLTQSYAIVLLGGILGIVMMRFAAFLFIRLIRAFPRMATTAYLLVFVIAIKLLLEVAVPGMNFHSQTSPETWAFWLSMGACLFCGFTRVRIRR